MSCLSCHRPSERGNAVIYILLTVALFAALAYVFMRGGQQGQGNMTSQRARIGAQEILSYAKMIEKRVDSLRTKGCSESQINFANTVWLKANGTAFHDIGSNANAPVDGSCDVFGTALAAQEVREEYTDLFGYAPAGGDEAAGSMLIKAMKFPQVGDANAFDIYLYIPWISDMVCMEMNNILNIPNTATTAPTHSGADTGFIYHGAMSGTSDFIDDSGDLTGKTAFCSRGVTGTGDTINRYFQVLIIR